MIAADLGKCDIGSSARRDRTALRCTFGRSGHSQPIEETEEGTDRWAIERGYVSMTPLRLDLTDEAALESAGRRHPVDRISFA